MFIYLFKLKVAPPDLTIVCLFYLYLPVTRSLESDSGVII